MIAGQRVLCVRPDPDVLGRVWPLVADMIDSAFAEADEVTPDYLPWLIEGNGLLWVLSDGERILGAATTSFFEARGGKALRVVAVGGEKGDWEGALREIEAYAWAEGCYKVKFDGRRGWGRVLSDYRPTCVSFEKRK